MQRNTVALTRRTPSPLFPLLRGERETGIVRVHAMRATERGRRGTARRAPTTSSGRTEYEALSCPFILIRVQKYKFSWSSAPLAPCGRGAGGEGERFYIFECTTVSGHPLPSMGEGKITTGDRGRSPLRHDPFPRMRARHAVPLRIFTDHSKPCKSSKFTIENSLTLTRAMDRWSC